MSEGRLVLQTFEGVPERREVPPEVVLEVQTYPKGDWSSSPRRGAQNVVRCLRRWIGGSSISERRLAQLTLD